MRITYSDTFPACTAQQLADELSSRDKALKDGVNLSLQNRGGYDAATAYDVNDLVLYAGNSYFALLASTGMTPGAAPAATFWLKLGGVLVGTSANTVAAGDDARFTAPRAPTGAAGGVLGGNYPNPTFAVDMATQAELDTVATNKADIAALNNYLTKSGNLENLQDIVAARQNLGLGNAATTSVGTGTNQVAQGDHTHTEYLPKTGLASFSVDTFGNVFGHNISALNSFYFPNSNLLMYSTAAVNDTGNAYTFTAADGITLRQIKASSVIASQFIRTNKLEVTNTLSATTVGAVTRKMEIFDAGGVSLGFIAIYDAIT